MISYFKNLRAISYKLKASKLDAGMTYVELIVVLSIFSIMSGIVLFNYNKFQAKVDIKNLANDIALKIVQAQKEALSGKLPAQTPIPNWKPSYGLYFDTSTDISKKSFIYFTDLNNNALYEDFDCTGECLNKISITKGDFISNLTVTTQGLGDCSSITALTVVFTRPDSGAKINTDKSSCTAVSSAFITISSPQLSNAVIKVYVSGRVQIN